jgi:TonB family protein
VNRCLSMTIALVGSSFALACVSAPPALSTFPARGGSVWSEDCCGDPVVETQPEYPKEAVRTGQTGWVVVSGILDERGWVTDPVVLAAEPEGIFDAAAVKAFDGWRYAAHSDPAKRREVRAVLTFHPPRKAGPGPASPPVGGGGGGSGGGGMGY